MHTEIAFSEMHTIWLLFPNIHNSNGKMRAQLAIAWREDKKKKQQQSSKIYVDCGNIIGNGQMIVDFIYVCVCMFFFKFLFVYCFFAATLSVPQRIESTILKAVCLLDAERQY